MAADRLTHRLKKIEGGIDAEKEMQGGIEDFRNTCRHGGRVSQSHTVLEWFKLQPIPD